MDRRISDQRFQVDSGNGLDRIDRGNPVRATLYGSQRGNRDIRNVRCHFRKNGKMCAPPGRGGVQSDNLRNLSHVGAGPALFHIRAGEIALDHISARFRSLTCKILPLLLVPSHDRSDDISYSLTAYRTCIYLGLTLDYSTGKTVASGIAAATAVVSWKSI